MIGGLLAVGPPVPPCLSRIVLEVICISLEHLARWVEDYRNITVLRYVTPSPPPEILSSILRLQGVQIYGGSSGLGCDVRLYPLMSAWADAAS